MTEIRGSPGICKNLTLSRKKRLNSVIDSKGSHTKY